MTRCGAAATAGVLALAALLAGCADDGALDAAAERDKALERVRQLERELAAAQQHLAERDKQVANLLHLGDKRMEKLYVVQRIRLGRATGGVDVDKKPGDDAIKVYVEPIDQHGSVLKAPAEVAIRLFDLAADANSTLISEHRFEVDETAAAWSSGFLAYHYRFTCPWKTPPKHGEITVRVEFLDYLTGKKHIAQKVCKIDLATGPTTRPEP
jgi:hypothetical protein